MWVRILIRLCWSGSVQMWPLMRTGFRSVESWINKSSARNSRPELPLLGQCGWSLEDPETREGRLQLWEWNSCFRCVCVCVCVLSCYSHVWLCNPMGYSQAPFLWRSSRQEYWSGLPWSPGDLPYPGIESVSLMSPALAGRFFTTRATWEALF